MNRSTRDHRQDERSSSDAAAMAGAHAGAATAAGQQAHAAAAPTFSDAEALITENQKGGAGYFAEAHHTASFNVDAQHREIELTASRLGRTDFGSPDIRVGDGSLYNPKFHADARSSYEAGAEFVSHDGVDAAKYAGQTILVPADQLDQVRALHQADLDAARSVGDEQRLQALESLSFADRIEADGIQSIPLTYDEAQAGAAQMRGGSLPGYAGDDASWGTAGVEGAALATGLALASTVGPRVFRLAAQVLRGSLDPQAAGLQLLQFVRSARDDLLWSAGRGGGAALLTVLDSLDPAGAALLVNATVDVLQLMVEVRAGRMPADRFGHAISERLGDRAVYTALAGASFWVAGPLGLLVPIAVRRMVPDQTLQAQTLRAWNSLADTLATNARTRAATVLNLQRIGTLQAATAARTELNDELARRLIDHLKSGQRPPLPGHGATPA